MKRILAAFLCGIILLCFTACDLYTNNNTQTTESTNQNNTNNQSTEGTNQNNTSNQSTVVFNTKNINRIIFYAYYGGGKGSEVPGENMTEIKNWLDSFTIVREATDEDVPPGTNTYYVEIEYLDGTILKNGLDIIVIDGTRYLLEKENYPKCFMDIISKTSLR